ncbi:MAG: DUF1559 domain-containing protein [Pirellulaceae bacterium]|nr:DUF1559 domain-containing protein [Pirellulaceae bacterium]
MPVWFTCPHCGRATHVADEFLGKSGPCAGCGRTVTIPAGPVPASAPPDLARFGDRGNDTGASYAPPESSTWMVIAIVLALSCLLGVGVLVALLMPAVGASREAARRMHCMNNLKQIALAMHNYHDVHGGFPAAFIADEEGRPLHSWRVALLPYLEQQRLYDQYNFNEPWDSPNNLRVAQQMPPVFSCPSAPAAPGSELTHYVVVVGDPANPQRQSLFMPNHWTKISQVLDGTSNTLLVVETADPVRWTQPDSDPTFDQVGTRVEAGPSVPGSFHPGGANVAMADGSVQFLPDDMDPTRLQLLIQPADGQPIYDWRD